MALAIDAVFPQAQCDITNRLIYKSALRFSYLASTIRAKFYQEPQLVVQFG